MRGLLALVLLAFLKICSGHRFGRGAATKPCVSMSLGRPLPFDFLDESQNSKSDEPLRIIAKLLLAFKGLPFAWQVPGLSHRWACSGWPCESLGTSPALARSSSQVMDAPGSGPLSALAAAIALFGEVVSSLVSGDAGADKGPATQDDRMQAVFGMLDTSSEGIIEVDEPGEIYRGPMSNNPKGEVEDLKVSLPLDKYGLILELGRSTILGAGFGVFVRLQPSVESVTLPAGTLLCKYALGNFQTEAPRNGSSAVFFTLSLRDQLYWHDQLWVFRDLLRPGKGRGLTCNAGVQMMDNSVNPSTSPSYEKGPPLPENALTISSEALEECCYYVPCDTTAEAADWMSIGQFFNDFAFTSDLALPGEAAYWENVDKKNIIAMRWEMEPGNTLRPKHPVMVLDRPMTFTNKQPMELGTPYGPAYWEAWTA